MTQSNGIAETWVKAFGYEDTHEVSHLGNVKSIPRTIPHGARGGGPRTHPGRVLTVRKDALGYRQVSLARNRVTRDTYIKDLVLASFTNEQPTGMVAHHIDGDTLNDNPTNLVWVPAHEEEERAEQRYQEKRRKIEEAKAKEREAREAKAKAEREKTKTERKAKKEAKRDARKGLPVPSPEQMTAEQCSAFADVLEDLAAQYRGVGA